MEEESQSVLEDVVANIWMAPIAETHLELSTKIGEYALGEKPLDLTTFTDPRKFRVGEYCPRFNVNSREGLKGKSVYITLIPNPYKSSENLVMRALINARTAKEHGAEKVILLATDLPSARQDRGVDEDEKALGEPNTVRLYADLFRTAGIDQVITTHAHTPRISAFFAVEYNLISNDLLPGDAPRSGSLLKVGEHFDPNDKQIQEIGKKVFKSINPHAVLADYILHHSSLVGSDFLKDEGAKFVLKAMDKGNRPFIDELYAALFLSRVSRIYCNKARKAKNDPNKVEVEIVRVSEGFDTMDGKCELFADDGADTCGTLIKAAEWSNDGNVCVETGKRYGVPEDRIVDFTHSWLAGVGYKGVQETLVKNLMAREFVTTNTRPYVGDGTGQYYRLKEKSTVLRLANLWGDAIIANELGLDVTTRYQGFASEEEQHVFLEPLYVLKRHSRHFFGKGSEPEKHRIKFYLRD